MLKPFSALRPLILQALALTVVASTGLAATPRKVVMIAGTPSHGPLAHEHNAGIQLLANCLEQGANALVKPVIHPNGWPKDHAIFAGADCVVIYSDGGGRHPALQGDNLKFLDELLKNGAGFVTLHYAVEPTKEKGQAEFLRWQGGAFEVNWSVNPHWTAKFEPPSHPITRGVKPFSANDEWYYHMRFVDGMKGVTPILSDLPGKETLSRPDGHHSGNPDVRKSVAAGKPQTVAWAYDRPDGGRGFGFTGGHNHLNWGNDDFRKTVLNAIVWAARAEVPAGGVQSKVTEQMLMANLDPKQGRPPQPKGKKKEEKQPGKKSAKRPAPVYSSPVVTKSLKGHAVDLDVDIAGAKELHLVITDGGNGYSCDWADWAEPRLVDSAGKETKLTELKWTAASSDWGQVRVGKNAGGRELRIAGLPVAYGIGAHANSLISYELPANHAFVRFKARGGLDNGGTDQGGGAGASVQFVVFTSAPDMDTIVTKTAPAAAKARTPEEAVANLDVHPKLQAQLFAAEPMLLNPSNIDIDHRGRVWVCEVVNYRRHNGTRKEGDRLLILEDTDGDAKADTAKTFYQGRDVDSAHGVTVLGTRDGRNTRVIVSAGDKVLVFTDTNGDDRADKQEVLFSGISGTQHDHGIHQFQFGPDGRLYFNFGNSGKQIKDAKSNVIVDRAGNRVEATRKPYQEGMVFRCNLDGSGFETLGWNFRNNWMVAVDSFGTLWQSDNDDDGNKGVRINYVMEFGNYGYKDELTGAGWKEKRTGWESEIPLRHWHLNDPGVMPNLLQTGQGSPTGICVYEGDLLPAEFHGQMIHCDAGPSVVRAYPVKSAGAGYTAGTINVLEGVRDRWFRPSDVKVAPDGSLIVADWYDPGVGGHNAQHIESGRLFRVAPKGQTQYRVPAFDFSSAEGCVAALKNPSNSARQIAWTELNRLQAGAKPALERLAADANPRFRARALWLLAAIKNNAATTVDRAAKDSAPDIRGMAPRLARQHRLNVLPLVSQFATDSSALVRRECLIALAGEKSPEAVALWVKLAGQHDGQDRWYLEALGIAARGNETILLDAWLAAVGNWNTPAGHDIVWRLRTPKAAPILAKIVTNPKTVNKERYLRALDFLPAGKEKDSALAEIAVGNLGL